MTIHLALMAWLPWGFQFWLPVDLCGTLPILDQILRSFITAAFT